MHNCANTEWCLHRFGHNSTTINRHGPSPPLRSVTELSSIVVHSIIHPTVFKALLGSLFRNWRGNVCITAQKAICKWQWCDRNGSTASDRKKKKAECETAFASPSIICICYAAFFTVAQAAVQKKMTKTEWFPDECISLACFNHHKNTVFCLEKSYNGYVDTVWTDGSKAARKALAGVHSVLVLHYRHCIWQAGSSLMHL